jgi:hypothetical protein
VVDTMAVVIVIELFDSSVRAGALQSSRRRVSSSPGFTEYAELQTIAAQFGGQLYLPK